KRSVLERHGHGAVRLNRRRQAADSNLPAAAEHAGSREAADQLPEASRGSARTSQRDRHRLVAFLVIGGDVGEAHRHALVVAHALPARDLGAEILTDAPLYRFLDAVQTQSRVVT